MLNFKLGGGWFGSFSQFFFLWPKGCGPNVWNFTLSFFLSRTSLAKFKHFKILFKKQNSNIIQSYSIIVVILVFWAIQVKKMFYFYYPLVLSLQYLFIFWFWKFHISIFENLILGLEYTFRWYYKTAFIFISKDSAFCFKSHFYGLEH